MKATAKKILTRKRLAAAIMACELVAAGSVEDFTGYADKANEAAFVACVESLEALRGIWRAKYGDAKPSAEFFS
jgi:hypothetical protein